MTSWQWQGSPLHRASIVALSFAALVGACGDPDTEVLPAEDPRSGGATTVFDDTRDAFARPLANLKGDRRDDFFLGNSVFNRGWVTAPASVADFDGLGPLFNATSCSGCHFKDGRGRPPEEPDESFLSMLVRLSVPGRSANGGPMPEPTYGLQIHENGVLGVPAEGRARVTYVEEPGVFADGTPYSLRLPRVTLHDPAFSPFGDDLMLSSRTAQHMPGLGLLEAVDEADILAREDPDDRDGDGISGRANRVWNPLTQRVELGRFGWKANAATLMHQSAAAANGDIGLTSTAFPLQNCPPAQMACNAAASGGTPELTDTFLDRIVFYLRTLAVPARRGAQRDGVVRGENVFKEMNCGSCHVPNLRTRTDATPAILAGQVFTPYTDLLLHDMGEGLADGRPDFLADGREWRTPPLWSIGMFDVVNDHTNYLHDGRARNLEEAILWHGGEAAAAQRAFVEADAQSRGALIEFLESL